MINLMTAIETWMRQNFRDCIGEYSDGGSVQLGPFRNEVPETRGIYGPKPPYATISSFSNPSDLGFRKGDGSGNYVEKPRVRFQLWDSDNDRCCRNIERLCAKLDMLTNLTLQGNEILVSILRTMPPQDVPQPIGRTGQRYYMWFCDVDEFRVQRPIGGM